MLDSELSRVLERGVNDGLKAALSFDLRHRRSQCDENNTRLCNLSYLRHRS